MVGGFFTGYGWKNTGDSIMMLDDDIDHACGGTQITNIRQRLTNMYYKNMNSPCYTAPKNYSFTRLQFGSMDTCETEYGSGKCENCHTKVIFNNQYPECRYLKELYINPWNEDCNICVPNCPSIAHPIGTWEYLIDTGTMGVGG